jgi:hypothetical protein
LINYSEGWCPSGDRTSARNEQHHAALRHHPANTRCPHGAIRSGVCLHLLIAGSPLPPQGGCARTERPRSDRLQAVGRQVASGHTGHNENKPAGQSRSASDHRRFCRQARRTPRSTKAPTRSNASSWPAPCAMASSHRPCQIRARYSSDRRSTAGSHGDTDRHAPTKTSTGHRRPDTVSTAWRVKDSNLGRHQPTDLQSAAVRWGCARLSRDPPAVPSACPSWRAPTVIHG